MIRSETRQQKRLSILRRLLKSVMLVFCVIYFLWPVFSDKLDLEDKLAPLSALRDNAEAETDSGKDALADVIDMAKETEATIDDEQNILMLVNKDNALPKDYVPDNLTSVSAATQAASGQKLSKPAAAAFEKLVAAAKENDHTIKLISGFRSYETQQQLYKNYVLKDGDYASEYSAEPGHSEHQTGLAADVSSPSVEYDLIQRFGETKEGIWLAENAHKFGFIVRYNAGKEDITGYIYEPWHIRYVGKEAALEMHLQNLTLEEYLNLM